jgi:hypothetical protein
VKSKAFVVWELQKLSQFMLMSKRSVAKNIAFDKIIILMLLTRRRRIRDGIPLYRTPRFLSA